MSKQIFITGTGTDVGKTYVAGLLVKKLAQSGKSAAYFKAAMSGNPRGADGRLIPQDALWVKEQAGLAQPLEQMCPYVYERAYSPHLAAQLEGHPVQWETVQSAYAAVCQNYDYVTMEGSGGILCPLRHDAQNIYLEDVISQFNLSSILVARSGLGTINEVVLTAFYMRAKHLPVQGIIFNHYHPDDCMERDNIQMCCELTHLPVLACVKDGDTQLEMDINALTSLYC